MFHPVDLRPISAGLVSAGAAYPFRLISIFCRAICNYTLEVAGAIVNIEGAARGLAGDQKGDPMIKFGLLGCGRIAKRHSDLLGGRHVDRASLAGVCDPIRSRADAIASKFGRSGLLRYR